jgi:hypothetical protein
MLQETFSSYGFTDVQVTGSGGMRIAEATWNKPDVTGQIDAHITSVTLIA